MKDLGSLPGYRASTATAINAAGTVVGYVDNDITDLPTHAFIWTAATGMRDLGVLVTGGRSVATAINRSGQVAGWASIGGLVHAVVWSADGTIRDLGTLGGQQSAASGINDLGQVVGSSDSRQGVTPFLWSAADGMTPLPTFGSASGVNNAGRVAGTASTATGDRPFRWASTSGLELLPGIDTDPRGNGRAVNDAGDIVGWTGDQSCDYYYGCSGLRRHAVLWTAGGLVVAVSTVAAGATEGTEGPDALGLNNKGQVVGVAGGHAFVWSAAGGLKDLGVLSGRTRSVATSINDAGQVVGTSDP
jgi:probable HAF family extracellular repeat protein